MRPQDMKGAAPEPRVWEAPYVARGGGGHQGRPQVPHRRLQRHTHCAIFADITAPCKHPQMPPLDRSSSL